MPWVLSLFRFDSRNFDFSSIRNPETVTHRLQASYQAMPAIDAGHNEDKPQSITLHHEVFNEATRCSGAIWLCYRSFYTASVGVSGKSPSNFTRLHIFCCSTTIITPVPLVSVPDTTTAVVLFLPVNCTCNRYPIARQRGRFHR